MHKKEMPVVLIVGIFALIVLVILMWPGVPKAAPGRAGYGLEDCPAPNCILYEASSEGGSWDTFSCLSYLTISADGGFFCSREGVTSCGKSATKYIHADDRAFHCRVLNIFTGAPAGSTSVQEGMTTWYCDQTGQFAYGADGYPVWFDIDKKPGSWTLTKPVNADHDCGWVCQANGKTCSGSLQSVNLPSSGGAGNYPSGGGFGQVMSGTTLQTCDSKGGAFVETVCPSGCLWTQSVTVPPLYPKDYSQQWGPDTSRQCLNDCEAFSNLYGEPILSLWSCGGYCEEASKSHTVRDLPASCAQCATDANCAVPSGKCLVAAPATGSEPSLEYRFYCQNSCRDQMLDLIASGTTPIATPPVPGAAFPGGVTPSATSTAPDMAFLETCFNQCLVDKTVPPSPATATCVQCISNADCGAGSCSNNVCSGGVPPPPGVSSISLTKTVNATNVTAGSLVSYTLVVTSTGNATAYNVSLSEAYPPSFVFINSTIAPSYGGNTTFLLGNLTPNSSVTVTIIMNATMNGTFNNTAHAGFTAANGTWFGTAYVTSTSSTTVGGPALPPPVLYSNVSVTKTSSVNGSMLTYMIVVKSTGTATAYNITLTEAYPSGVVFVSSTPVPTSGNSTFFLGDIIPNASITVTILMNVTVNGTYNNTASVVFAGGAGVGASSVGSTSTTVGPPPPAPAPTPSGGGGGGGGGGGSRGGVLCPTYCLKDPKYSDPNYPGYVYIPICNSPACLAMSKVVQPAPPISQPASTRETPVCNDNKKTYPENCDPPGSACNDNTGACAADCMSCVVTPAKVVEAAPPEVSVVEAPPAEAPKVVKAKSKAWVAAIPVAVLIIGGIAYYYIRRRLLGMPL